MSVRRLSTSSVLNAFPKTNGAWDQTTNAATFDCLGTVTLATATSTISFIGIPSTYKHLHIRMSARSSNGSTDYAQVKFNNDNTAGNYYRHVTYTTGGIVDGVNSSTNTYVGSVLDSTQTASAFAPYILDVAEYSSSSKLKTVKIFGGFNNNGGGEVSLTSILYMSTNPITTATVTLSSGANCVQYSHISIYGVK